jgi:hypothetical protein
MTRYAALGYAAVHFSNILIFQHLTLSALETFTGRPIAEEVKNNINHPCNAFNAQTDARDTFNRLAWSIEAVYDGEVVSGFSN